MVEVHIFVFIQDPRCSLNGACTERGGIAPELLRLQNNVILCGDFLLFLRLLLGSLCWILSLDDPQHPQHPHTSPLPKAPWVKTGHD